MTAHPRGREQWLLAGQALLRRGGVGAVKLQALTDHLGLTTGSFYHHFAAMGDYLDQLARHYGTDQVVTAVASIDDPDPARRLRRLAEMSRDERMGPLDTAMRDWAGSSPVAADAVRAADETLLRFIERAFLDLGHPSAEARTRALLLFSTGVARVHPPWPVPTRILDRVLDVLVPLVAEPVARRP